MPFAATCVDVEIIILSEISQSQISYDATYVWAFLCGSAGKESACNSGDLGSIPGLGTSPVEGKGYPLQYSGLENSMDCVVHGVAESDTTEQLSLSYVETKKKKKRDNKWTYLQNRNKLPGIDNKLMDTRGGGGIS